MFAKEGREKSETGMRFDFALSGLKSDFVGFEKDEVLRLAAAVENASEHPIVRAIVAKATDILEVMEFQSTTGVGVSGMVAGRRVEVGRAESGGETGATVVAVHVDKQLAGHISVMDQPKGPRLDGDYQAERWTGHLDGPEHHQNAVAGM